MTVVALSALASRLSLAAPQSFRGLVVVPLVDRAAAPSGLLTLDEALASGAAEVTEVSEAGAVPHLRLLNRGAGQLFLLDGEELAGAKQNRILNLSLLVPGGTALDIPVSCVEQGRWSWRDGKRGFAGTERVAFAKLRRRNAEAVSLSMRSTGRARSDQGAVWESIAEKSARMSVHSDTGAAAALFEGHRATLDAFVEGIVAVPGQVGAAFVVNGRLAGLDLLAGPDLLGRLLPKLVRSYLRLKLQELFLTHEYREKVKAERDEWADAARLQREEQKLIRDMERAEEEEARYQRLLDKAKAEAQSVVGPKLEAFQAQVEILEKDLAEAHAKFERAQAMAERTRSGYVYIISNVGSFGDDVVKIGVTRRLDPADRIRELGDASVPFLFDTHAIIYSDDAPALERALRAEFEPGRINAKNYRKEFVKAGLGDVESAVKRLAPDAPFFKDVEAQEYRETLARRSAALVAQDAQAASTFPAAI